MKKVRCVALKRSAKDKLHWDPGFRKQIWVDGGIGDWLTYRVINAQLTPNVDAASHLFADADIADCEIKNCSKCKHKLVCLIEPRTPVRYEPTNKTV